jgi:hypothetical protein
MPGSGFAYLITVGGVSASGWDIPSAAQRATTIAAGLPVTH